MTTTTGEDPRINPKDPITSEEISWDTSCTRDELLLMGELSTGTMTDERKADWSTYLRAKKNLIGRFDTEGSEFWRKLWRLLVRLWNLLD